MEELQLHVCVGADKPHKKVAFWNSTFLKPGKKVSTAKVRKKQYSWKDNSLQQFDIIQKTIFSSTSFWEMSSSIFTFFGAKACLPASLCVSDEIWNALLSPNQICWEQHLDLIESQPKFQFQRTQQCHRWKEVPGRTGCLPGVRVKWKKRQQAHLTFPG